MRYKLIALASRSNFISTFGRHTQIPETVSLVYNSSGYLLFPTPRFGVTHGISVVTSAAFAGVASVVEYLSPSTVDQLSQFGAPASRPSNFNSYVLGGAAAVGGLVLVSAGLMYLYPSPPLIKHLKILGDRTQTYEQKMNALTEIARYQKSSPEAYGTFKRQLSEDQAQILELAEALAHAFDGDKAGLRTMAQNDTGIGNIARINLAQFLIDDGYTFTQYHQLLEPITDPGLIDIVTSLRRVGAQRLESRYSGVPDEYLCKISFDIMRDPVYVVDETGRRFYYDRPNIERWFERHLINPDTNLPLRSVTLFSDPSLRIQIDDWIHRHPGDH